jgi:hypothetical protein
MLRQDGRHRFCALCGSCCKDESGMNACIRLPVFLSYDGATRTIPVYLQTAIILRSVALSTSLLSSFPMVPVIVTW